MSRIIDVTDNNSITWELEIVIENNRVIELLIKPVQLLILGCRNVKVRGLKNDRGFTQNKDCNTR